MRKAVIIGIVGIGLLAGCINVATQMNIIDQQGQSEFLMGEITSVNGGYNKINFAAESISKSCGGTSMDGQVSLALSGDTYSHQFPVSCSDGSNGLVRLRFKLGPRGSMTGSGIGQMSDGADVRISIGETSGGIVW